MGGVFVKKWKMGFFCVKKWTFPQRRVHYVQHQYFLLYILLIWGGVDLEKAFDRVPREVISWELKNG